MNSCNNCGNTFEGKYCNQCGQKLYTDKDKSVPHLLEESFHFLTHFEGTFFNTLKAIVAKPGKLSLDYSKGIRKKYFKPISFYLMIVILYLIFPLFKGLNMDMKYYKGLEVTGTYIENRIERKLATDGISEADLTEKFHKASEKSSKILLLLFIPLSAFLIYVLYFKKRRFLFDDFILATEINSFYLLIFYLIFPVLYYLFIDITGLYTSESILSIIIISLFTFYVYIVFRRVLSEKIWLTILKSILFTIIHSYVFMTIYKTLVFEISFWMT